MKFDITVRVKSDRIDGINKLYSRNNVSIFYILRTLISWMRFNVSEFDYTVKIKKHLG